MRYCAALHANCKAVKCQILKFEKKSDIFGSRLTLSSDCASYACQATFLTASFALAVQVITLSVMTSKQSVKFVRK